MSRTHSKYRSHPYVPYDKHFKCLLQYNKAMHSIGYENLVNDIMKNHDLGKLNNLFQERIEALEKGEIKRREHADMHAVLSTIILLICAILQKGEYDNWNKQDKLDTYLLLNVIKAHHGRLISPQEFNSFLKKYALEDSRILIEGLKNLILSSSPLSEKIKQFTSELEQGQKKWLIKYPEPDNLNINDIAKAQLLLSRLVDTDRLSAARNSEYNQRDIERLKWPSVVENFRAFLQTKPSNPVLSNIRNHLNLERWRNRPATGVYSLVLPTGTGKTVASLQLLDWWKTEGARSVIVVPFLAISDQTEKVFRNMFKEKYEDTGEYLYPEAKAGGRLITVHHHLAPAQYDTLEDESEKIDDWTMIERWSGEVTITTTVQFFETLMSRRASNLRKLHMTYGATIIIDEPQTIPYGLWTSFKNLLSVWADVFQWRVILLSATPPALPKNTTPLIAEPGILYQALTRTRLKLHPKQNGPEEWAKKAKELTIGATSILWLVNTVEKAENLYELAKEYEYKGYLVEFLTANMCMLHREIVYNRIKETMENKKPILVISTQVLEAGVDLDFEKVVRELAPIPMCIQVAGRDNRKGEREQATVHIIPFTNSRSDQVYTEIEMDITVQIFEKYGYTIPEKEYLTVSNLFFDMCDQNEPLKDIDWEKAYAELNIELDHFHMIKEQHGKEQVIVTANIPESQANIVKTWERLTGNSFIPVEEVIEKWIDAFNNKDHQKLQKLKHYIALYTVNASKKRLSGRMKEIKDNKGEIIGLELHDGYGKTGVTKIVDLQ